MNGKPEQGSLYIKTKITEDNRIHITYSDDGSGLNLNLIRQKGLDLGLLQDKKNNFESIANTIFYTDFQPKVKSPKFRGRVGLNAVQHFQKTIHLLYTFNQSSNNLIPASPIQLHNST